jgi:hypothetical protein
MMVRYTANQPRVLRTVDGFRTAIQRLAAHSGVGGMSGRI